MAQLASELTRGQIRFFQSFPEEGRPVHELPTERSFPKFASATGWRPLAAVGLIRSDGRCRYAAALRTECIGSNSTGLV